MAKERIISRVDPEVKETIRYEAFKLKISVNKFIAKKLEENGGKLTKKGDEK